MSVCTFIASNAPLREIAPAKEYPCTVNIDAHTIDDGGADDNFFLRTFEDVHSYTDKKYGVCLEWHYATDGRAGKILEYVKNALEQDAVIEIWHVWLTDYWEYDERPMIKKRSVSFADMTIDDIKKIDSGEIWNQPDPQNPNRPAFYCLRVER